MVSLRVTSTDILPENPMGKEQARPRQPHHLKAWFSLSVFERAAETRWHFLIVPLPIRVKKKPPVSSLHPCLLCGQSPDSGQPTPIGSDPSYLSALICYYSYLSALIGYCSFSHSMLAALLSLKQASSASTPGPLHVLFSLMECFLQLCTSLPFQVFSQMLPSQCGLA